MRFTLPTLALGLATLVHGSAGQTAAAPPLSAPAAALDAAGGRALATGNAADAIDDFEAALAWQPGNDRLLLDLAVAARAQGMQGKALHYYRLVLAHSPNDEDALAGEGETLAEQGALAKARGRLAQLQGLCGADCPATRKLALAIDRAAARPVVTAEAIKPTTQTSAN